MCIRDGMKRLGMGVRELPDMKRVGTEMASAGADGETRTSCRDGWGCRVRVQVSPPYPQVTCAVPWPFGSCGMRRPCHTKPHSVGNEVVTCKVSKTELLRSYSGLLSRATPAYIPALLRCTFPRYSGVHSRATPVHTPVLLQSTTGLDRTPLDLPFDRTRA